MVTTLQKLENAAVLITGTKGQIYELPATVTGLNRDIVLAQAGTPVSQLQDETLKNTLSSIINRALLLLGHKRQWDDPNDQLLFVLEVLQTIRAHYSYYTLEEIKLIFQIGIRGELQTRPEDVVFLNITNVNTWLKNYKYSRKPEAMKIIKLIPATDDSHLKETFSLADEFDKLIQSIKEGHQPNDIEWTLSTRLYYDWLKEKGFLDNTREYWQAVLTEERQKVKDQGRYDLDQLKRDKKVSFHQFLDSIETGPPASNPYEKRVLSNCRIRVFKEYVNKLTTPKD